jgi:hypothetical protein
MAEKPDIIAGDTAGLNSSGEKVGRVITRTTSHAVAGDVEDAAFSADAAVNFRTNG